MASRQTISDTRKQEVIGNNVSEIPGKLVLSKRGKIGKLNLDLVSSTPMNPTKRAKFFDESNQLGSPIRSGSSTAEINTNTPDNKIKSQEVEQNTKKKMLTIQEQTAGASPFPFFTKLSVKKMTICASDEDSDDNIFAKPDAKVTKTNKKLKLDSENDSNTDEEDTNILISEDDEVSKNTDKIVPKKTETKTEPVKKLPVNTKTIDKTEINLTKTAKVKLVDIKSNKTKSSKTSEENKENINTKIRSKTKSPDNKTVKKQTDIVNESNLDISFKKTNTKQEKKMVKNKNEKKIDNESTRSKTLSTRLASTNNDTNRSTAIKSMRIPESGLRKSVRSRPSTVPYWMTPWKTNENITGNVTNNAKRTKSKEIDESIKSITENKRSKIVPETISKKKESTRVEKKLETTITLNRSKTRNKSGLERKDKKNESIDKDVESTITLNKSKTRSKFELDKKDKTNESIENDVETTITLNKSKTRSKFELDKKDKTNESIEKDVESTITSNRSKNKSKITPKKREKEKNVTLLDEVPENIEKIYRSKTKLIDVENELQHKNKILENIEKFNRLKTKLIDKQLNKEDPENTKNLSRSKTKLIEVPENIKNVNRSKTNLNEFENEKQRKKEVSENIKISTKSKTKMIDVENNKKRKKETRPQRSMLKSNENEDTQVIAVNEKEVLNKENRKKKYKLDNIASSIKSNLNDSYFQSRFEFFEVSDTETREPRKTATKSSPKRKAMNTKEKMKNMSKTRTLRSRRPTTSKSYRYEEDIENITESDDSSNSESSIFETVENIHNIPQVIPRPRLKKQTAIEKSKPIKKIKKRTVITPGLIGKRVLNTKNIPNKSKSKQVNFNSENDENTTTMESDSNSFYDEISNRPKLANAYEFNLKRNPHKQYSSVKDVRYPRKTLFYQKNNMDRGYRRSPRKNKYMINNSTFDESDTFSSDEMYMVKGKQHRYMYKNAYKKRGVDNSCFINFKERAIAAQVPNVTQTLTEIKSQGRTMMIECFGHFPKVMTKLKDNSSLRGTCFVNEKFASGVMELAVGNYKTYDGSENYTYFVILDGIAEIGIGTSTKIMRLGDNCIVPKHTFYYVANASGDMKLLLNFLKISL